MSFPSEEAAISTFELLRRTKSGAPFGGQSTDALAAGSATDKEAAILVADDSSELRNVIRLVLQSLGYNNVAESKDGAETLVCLRRQKFDLLILDIDMPRLTGFEVLALLKKDPALRHLPVIVASGLDQLGAVARCIELGAEDFLPKPINAVILGARIGASLERKRLRDLEQLRLVELQQEKERLQIEQEKSERLLLNILPKSIAERLKRGEHAIAERYASVTVLFADVVDFINLANYTDPHDLVALLNDLFSRFDHIADHHGLEKIKTIGDSYLVVGGLPEPHQAHAGNVAAMALEMLAALREFNQARGINLSIRIGINSGPVVAGVIGRRKFAYDLWGATVNLAHRMQSSGLPNRISISAATRDLLDGKYLLTERGTIHCKGLGEIQSYLLEDEKSAGSPPVIRASPAKARRKEQG